jgi:Uma2 family endonuclease
LLATHAPFAPALVVEALSVRTAHLDSGPKFTAYEAHGVQEYWILDPEHLYHRFFRREGELLVEFSAGAEMISSQAVPGFWLRRSWLNPEKLPAVSQCLAEIGLA